VGGGCDWSRPRAAWFLEADDGNNATWVDLLIGRHKVDVRAYARAPDRGLGEPYFDRISAYGRWTVMQSSSIVSPGFVQARHSMAVVPSWKGSV
jgi:hypothetical protein